MTGVPMAVGVSVFMDVSACVLVPMSAGTGVLMRLAVGRMGHRTASLGRKVPEHGLQLRKRGLLISALDGLTQAVVNVLM